MLNFIYQAAPMRGIFGAGTFVQLPGEPARLGISRALILATPSHERQASNAASMLGSGAAGIFAQAAMHTPVDVTDRAMACVQELAVELLPSAAARQPDSAKRSRCEPICNDSTIRCITKHWREFAM